AKLVEQPRIGAGEAASPRVLVIPRTPGPLVDPDALAPERAADEIDEIVDDLFGPDPVAPPGWLDVTLLAGGFGLVGWSLASVHSTALTVVGAILAFLGTVLPARLVLQTLRQRPPG